MTNLKDIEQASYTAPVVVSDEMVQTVITVRRMLATGINIQATGEITNNLVTGILTSLLAHIDALSSAPFPETVRRGALEVNFMQRVWANLYFDEHDAGYTFQQTLNDVVEWLSTRSALPDVGSLKSSTIHALQTAQPESAVKVDEWQPIETAPRDWSDVLLFDAALKIDHRKVYEGYYDTEFSEWHSPAAGVTSPTHWMPLPAAPLTRIGGAE